LGNFPDTQAFGKFFRYPAIWQISEIPRHLGNSSNSYRYLRVVYFKDFGNFSNDWIIGEFPINLGIWEISQITRHLGNSPNSYRYLRVVNF